MRRQFFLFSFCLILLTGVGLYFSHTTLWTLFFTVPFIGLGLYDATQKRQSILRNFPVLGHFRYLMESIRPEINQYFIESNSNGVPFSRELRSIVYQRGKKQLDTLPFGTQKNVYEVGYEWLTHSLTPSNVESKDLRVVVGGPQCSQPYSASIFNISAMSYGSLSKNAILALNGGAKLGNFYHNTGEGGLSEYHLKPGGAVVWQIGTGYFGCRDAKGNFHPELFKERATLPNVKMIEIKLSQGAKPSHGGILPAAKVTPEIVKIRNVEIGKDVISPAAHTAFGTPVELLEFVQKLRSLSDGKPVGFKLCVGKRREFVSICKAMLETKIYPDFITVDGGEGGTGAAPAEFSNHVGFPLREALIFVHNALVGFGVRDKIRIIASGRNVTGFDIISRFAIGADICNSARAMMMALGCIQALKCNSNECPTGVATQNPNLVVGLNVTDKTQRVANFHKETVKSTAELMRAIGVKSSHEVRPWHILRRTGPAEIKHYGEIYSFLNSGDLLKNPLPKEYARSCTAASPFTFSHTADIEARKSA